MRPERECTTPVKPTRKQKLMQWAVRAGSEIMRSPTTRWAETMGKATPIEFPPNSKNQYVQAIKDGCIPILITNHSSDYDGIPAAMLTDMLTTLANENLPLGEQLEGFLMITARSLQSEQQKIQRPGETIIFDALEHPFLSKHAIRPLFTTTKHDRTRDGSGLPKNSEEFAEELDPRLATGKFGVFLFPEATVNSGRLDKDGRRRGMQKFTPGAIAKYVTDIKELTGGRDVVIISAAISGGYKVYDHQTSRPTRKILAGFRHGDPEVVTVTVSPPVRSRNNVVAGFDAAASVKQKIGIDRFFGRRIAAMLPPEERGTVYYTDD